MEMKIRVGNLLESSAQTLVNTVNTVGVMGKGIALEFKKWFPEMHRDYVERCAAGSVKLGEPYLYRSVIPPWILNFPTKDHWRSVSRLSDIVAGLEYLERHYRQWGITSLAVPPLGCGYGGLDWHVVGPTLYRHLKRLDIPVELYAPHGTPPSEMNEAFLDQPEMRAPIAAEQSARRLSPSWIALAEILCHIVRQPHHWPVGRTSFQKLAYFATEAGIPTQLKYEKGSYGPYAADVAQLLSKLVNNGVVQEKRLGRMLAVLPGPTYKDAREAYSDEIAQWKETIERVADLMQRLRTTQQAEIASTVHFAARNLAHRPGKRPSEQEVLNEVMEWKRRRNPPLDKAQVALAIRALGALGWIDLQASKELPVPDDELLGV